MAAKIWVQIFKKNWIVIYSTCKGSTPHFTSTLNPATCKLPVSVINYSIGILVHVVTMSSKALKK